MEWAAGGFDDLERIARTRTDGGTSWAAWAAAQGRFSVSMFGLLGLVTLLAGPFLAHRRRSTVVPLCVVWAVGLTYSVVFHHGAEIHPYWNVALLPAVALGAALVADRIDEVGRRASAALVAVCLVALGVGAVGSARAGAESDGLGELARLAGTQPAALHTTELASAWLSYESGRSEVSTVPSCAALVELAEEDPGANVLTHRRWSPWAPPGVWQQVTAAPSARVDGPAALVQADDLAALCH